MEQFDQRKLVALDIGGVCVQLHKDLCYAELGYDTEAVVPEHFLNECIKLEKGLTTNENWLNLFMETTEHRFTRTQLLRVWNNMIGFDIPGMGQAVRALSDRCRFVYFSNTSRLHLNEVVRKNRFGHLVSGGVFSFEAGYMKPEPEIYHIFEQTYGIPFAYFDDNVDNIEAAKKRGWNGHVFHDAETFYRILDTLS